jgi:glyoxylase-like metal-dependent hydrolase (beta-lactamase superfamily II)
MNVLEKAFRTLRTWAGLADPDDSRLTPGHGWLLPAVADARRHAAAEAARRAAGQARRDGGA